MLASSARGTPRIGRNRARMLAVMLTVTALSAGLMACSPPGFSGKGPTSDLVTGAWSWFEGPRAIVTRDGCGLLAGSSGRTGTDAVVQVGRWGVGPAVASRTVLDSGQLPADDHNSPGLLELADGSVLAAWAGHSEDDLIRSAVRDVDGTWRLNPTFDAGAPVEYNNLFQLSDGTVLDIVRQPSDSLHPGDPQVYATVDEGTTWTRLGTLATHTANVFPQRPYLRFAQLGDRIDFIATQANPNLASSTDVFHGYLLDGAVYTSDGAVAGTLGGPPPEVTSLTPVFATPPGTSAWTSDVAVDGAGNPVAVFSVRDTTVAWDDPAAIRYSWAHWTGAAWDRVDLAPGGRAVYGAEPHYSGNIAVDPAAPTHVILSTTVDPTSGADLGQYDLFEMQKTDGSTAWTTARLTNTPANEYRPVITQRNDGVQAALWFTGNYVAYNSYSTTVQYRLMDAASPTDRAARCGAPRDLGRPSVTGDFDADGRTDVLQHGPGFAENRVSWGAPRPDTLLASASLNLPGTYQPVTGDFDGDRRADIFWYSSNGASIVWWSTPNRDFQSRSMPTTSGLTPVVGDFDGDHRADIFWYGPAGAADTIWWGNANRTFTPQSISIGGAFSPRSGDFDGDGYGDVLWYGAAGGPTKIWWGSASRTFLNQGVSISAAFQPFTGDFDGDRRTDIFWYAPGAAADSIWWGASTRTFTEQARPVGGVYTPFVGDFDGNGLSEIYWDGAGATGDSIWWWSSARTYFSVSGIWQ